MVEVGASTAAPNTAIITLVRPERANAYTQPMLARLSDILRELSLNTSVRAVVVTGTGPHFCAGADRGELDERCGEDSLDLLSRRTFDQLARMPQPVIAAIRGAAFGGGLELALACDVRVCALDARLALPETRLGLMPAAGGVRRLVPLIGPSRTKELVLWGRELDAATALAWGVVTATDADVIGAALGLAASISRGDAVAQRLAKTSIDAAVAADDTALEAAIQAFLYERRRR